MDQTLARKVRWRSDGVFEYEQRLSCDGKSWHYTGWYREPIRLLRLRKVTSWEEKNYKNTKVRPGSFATA